MKEFIEKLIGEIYTEQLKYDEYSYEYQQLSELIRQLEELYLQEADYENATSTIVQVILTQVLLQPNEY